MPQHCSSSRHPGPHPSGARRGLFVTVDGPSGVGKSTIVRRVCAMLVAAGHPVHVTAEPSEGPIGVLCRRLTDTVTGHALACLYAADRYHHLDTEIRPRREAGVSVLCDRYLASSLAMQRFDDTDPTFLGQLNAHVDRPDLTILLDAEPDIIAGRLAGRGMHNRFQRAPDSTRTEVAFYRQAADWLAEAGFAVLRLDCSGPDAEQPAARIRDQLATLCPASPAGT